MAIATPLTPAEEANPADAQIRSVLRTALDADDQLTDESWWTFGGAVASITDSRDRHAVLSAVLDVLDLLEVRP